MLLSQFSAPRPHSGLLNGIFLCRWNLLEMLSLVLGLTGWILQILLINLRCLDLVDAFFPLQWHEGISGLPTWHWMILLDQLWSWLKVNKAPWKNLPSKVLHLGIVLSSADSISIINVNISTVNIGNTGQFYRVNINTSKLDEILLIYIRIGWYLLSIWRQPSTR